MEIKRINSEEVLLCEYKDCTVTVQGDVIDVVYADRRNRNSHIIKLSADEYIMLSDGEVRPFRHSDSKLTHKENLYRTFSKIRNIINTNVTDPERCRWLTLTYAENMTDPQRLYRDFERFIKKAHRRWGSFEYISVVEPQARGAWHCHVILIFPTIAPYMANTEVADLWGQGFVRIEAIREDVDNIGAYLSAYLSDVQVEGSDGQSKAVIKGGRIGMYPPGMRIFRHSRGIHLAPRQVMTWGEVQALVGDAVEVYAQAYEITDKETGFENRVCKMQFNRARKK